MAAPPPYTDELQTTELQQRRTTYVQGDATSAARAKLNAVEIVLADHLGTGTLDSVEHRGQVFEDVPAVWAAVPSELEHGEYPVRAVFGEHGEFGLQLADEVLWIAVPAETLAAAEDLGLLGVVTGEHADGTLDYFLIWWQK